MANDFFYRLLAEWPKKDLVHTVQAQQVLIAQLYNEIDRLTAEQEFLNSRLEQIRTLATLINEELEDDYETDAER